MCSVLSFSDEAGEPFAIPAGEDLHVPPNATVCTISFLSIINIAVQATHTNFLVKIPWPLASIASCCGLWLQLSSHK